MCIATAAAIAGIAGSGISAIGGLTTGAANASQSNFQAQVAANNAKTASDNAAYAIKAGEQRATNEGLKGRAEGQHLKAELAANGSDVNSGSAVDVQTSQGEKAQLDTETTRQDAALTAYGYRTQSTNFLAEQQLEQAKAGFATEAGIFSAGGSLLSGASAIGMKWPQVSGGGDWSPRSDASVA